MGASNAEILKYIAASPAKEHGGFDERTVAAAKWALQEIEHLRSGGAGLIAIERQRQITEEGWTAEHDDRHTNESLTEASYCYAMRGDHPMYATRPPASWPWDRQWWKPKDHIRNLVIAGALIAAEIDRLRRAAGVAE